MQPPNPPSKMGWAYQNAAWAFSQAGPRRPVTCGWGLCPAGAVAASHVGRRASHWVQANLLASGNAVRRPSGIASVAHNAESSGDLMFVRVKHELYNLQALAFLEEHVAVYRANLQPGCAVPVSQPSGKDSKCVETITPDEVLRCSYPPLTFKGHRVHCDRHHMVGVDGCPGHIVHGPLTATFLVQLVQSRLSSAHLTYFHFRSVRPVFDIASFKLRGTPSTEGETVQLWTDDHEGWLTTQASVALA